MKKTAMKFVLIISTFFIFIGILNAQESRVDESGLPLITTYGLLDYNGHPQTRSILQDKRGVMYFANGYGILEFDGSRWRLIKTKEERMCHSLDMDNKGRIYVGASGDLGYLKPNQKGELCFESLSHLLKKKDKEFSYIWTTHVTSDGIYFQSAKRVFLFSPENNNEHWKVKVVWKIDQPEDQSCDYAFWFDNAYYLHILGKGLMKIVKDQNGEYALQLIEGSKEYSDDRLHVMLPYKDKKQKAVRNKMILGYFNKGLRLFDGSNSSKPFGSYETNEFLKENTLYAAVTLNDNMYGFCTRNGGFLITDEMGNIIKLIDIESAGLTSNSISTAFQDREGNIWLSPDGGIAILSPFPSPLTFFHLDKDNASYITSIIRQNDILYSGGQGLSFLRLSSNKYNKHKFQKMKTNISQCFGLLSMDDEVLVAAGDQGLFRIKDGVLKNLIPGKGTDFAVLSLHQSKINPKRIFLGLFKGVAYLEKDQNGNWGSIERLRSIDYYIYNIQESEPGILWLGTFDQGAIRVDMNNDIKINKFGKKEGLSDGHVPVFKINKEVIFGSFRGLSYYKKEENRFYPYPALKEFSKNSIKNEDRLIEDKFDNIWYTSGQKLHFLKKEKAGYFEVENKAVNGIADEPIFVIYQGEKGIVWFGGMNRIYRYDPKVSDPLVNKENEINIPTLIRSVRANNEIKFDGYKTLMPTQKFKNDKQKIIPCFSAGASIRIEFAAPSFNKVKDNKFKWYLKGYDKDWSNWSSESKKDYTNLSGGNYKFQVKSKNQYGESSEDVYEFRVLYPWYLTVWSILFYFFAVSYSIYLLIRLKTRRHRERSRELEETVRKRTSELKEKNIQLVNKQDQLQKEKEKIVQLSEIGQDITATLDFDELIKAIHKLIETIQVKIDTLMDATIFGIGIYKKEENSIYFPATKEKGETLPGFSYSLEDDNRPAVWSFKNQKVLFTNNYKSDYGKYIDTLQPAVEGENPESMIYLPLSYRDKQIGLLTVQSLEKNAYSDSHLSILRTLATYIAIAFDNAETYKNLESTLEQLVAQEKLATLGTIAAGVAHEINNPLNFVVNFSNVSKELVEDLWAMCNVWMEKHTVEERDQLKELISTLNQNADKIILHGKRMENIVTNILLHSTGSSQVYRPTDVNSLLEEGLNLSFHSMKAKDESFNVTIEKNFDESIGQVELVSQDINRVFINLINNGYYEVHKKAQEGIKGYSPTLSVSTKNYDNQIEILIRDNGNGFPPEVKQKLFEPFYTTKPNGQGTGLGLYICRSIVEAVHKGKIIPKSKPGHYAEFKIILPRIKKDVE